MTAATNIPFAMPTDRRETETITTLIRTTDIAVQPTPHPNHYPEFPQPERPLSLNPLGTLVNAAVSKVQGSSWE